jgi:hypothetical protein
MWFICMQYLTFVCPIARACIQLLIDRDLVEMIDHWNVLYQFSVVYADRKSKMATIAGHRLTFDPMGKCSNAFFLTAMLNIRLERKTDTL